MIIDLRSGRIRLRTSQLSDVDALLASDGFDPDSDGASVRARREQLRNRIDHDPDLLDDGLMILTVEADGAPVGDIQARAPRFGFPRGVCEIGITLAAESRGEGTGRIAVSLFTAYLLDDGWSRVQATTAIDNLAMRRVLERCGFVQEGVLNSYLPGPDSARSDAAIYARLGLGPGSTR